MKALMLTALLFTASFCFGNRKPNVLIISIDDLNDWVGCLGGHPDTKTPNIDKLAAQGSLFSNAHCAVPMCIPSRTSLLSGVSPVKSGIYDNFDGWHHAKPSMKNIETLPDTFKKNGYTTMSAGKVFHTYPRPYKSLFDINGGSFKGQQMNIKSSRYKGFMPESQYGIYNFSYHWGPLNERQSANMADTQIVKWTQKKLLEKYDTPFLMMIGFHRPHTPLTSPQKNHDAINFESLSLPPVFEDRIKNLPSLGKNFAFAAYQDPEGGMHKFIKDNNHWKAMVHSYLAAVNYVDECVGKVLDSLEKSQYSKNTIVVLYSDHGWGLGEHAHWQKWGLWEDITHVPLIIKTPGQTPAVNKQAASLLDLYPTLIDLCKLSKPAHMLDGDSLVKYINNPMLKRSKPVMTTLGPGNHSLRTESHRYIGYADGGEELYDHKLDTHEWDNLAKDTKSKELLEFFRKYLPTDYESAPISTPDNLEYIELNGDQKLIKTLLPGKGLVNTNLSVNLEIKTTDNNGVILHHGGQFSGYALYLKNRKVYFSVMDVPQPLSWDNLVPKIDEISSNKQLPEKRVKLTAILTTKGEMIIKIDDVTVAKGNRNGPLQTFPAGELSINDRSKRYRSAGYFPKDSKLKASIEKITIKSTD